MILLANFFALGCLAGGAIAGLLSCYLIGDSDTWFPLLVAGYGVVGCIWAAIYGPIVKVLGFGRMQVTTADGRRTFLTAVIAAIVQYLFAVVTRTHEYDRVLLFAVPLCAAFVDVARVRKIGSRQVSSTPPVSVTE